MSPTAEFALTLTDWTTIGHAGAAGVRVPDAIKTLLASETPQHAALNEAALENLIVAQGSVEEAAEPAISVLLAALADDPPSHIRVPILDLLFQICIGGPADQADVGLIARCHDRVREGLWLLVREAVEGARDAALDVLDIVDESRASALRDYHPRLKPNE